MEKLKKYILPAVTLLAVVIAVFVIVLLIRKKSGDEYVVNAKYAEYVSAITSGVISCESTIKVVLVEPFQGDSAQREQVIKNIYSFSPGIDGTTRWFDNRTIEFIPEKRLESGTKYEVEFKLGNLVDVPADFKTMKFSFIVIKQDINVTVEGLRTYEGIYDKYYIEGLVKTSDVADNENVEKVISAKIEGQDLSITWTHNENRTDHKFRIDSINRTTAKQNLTIDWNGKDLNVANTGNMTVSVPAIGEFIVLDIKNVAGTPEYFLVTFSDQLDPNQNLDGLITVDGSSNMRFEIDRNTVSVYYELEKKDENFQLVVNEGVKNYKGDKIVERFSKSVRRQEIKPAVEIIGKGVIMPNSGKVTLPFRAVNLKAVEVSVVKVYESNIVQFLQVNNLNGTRELKRVGREVFRKKITLQTNNSVDYGMWNTFSIDLSDFISAEPGALYRVTFSFRKAYSLYPCEKDTTETNVQDNEQEIMEQSGVADDGSWDASDNDYYYGDYYYNDYYYEYDDEGSYWDNRQDPCKNAYYNSDRMPSVNLLASNIGLIGKLNKNNEVHVAVTDINTAKPLSDITIEILDFQQQVMAKTTTNSDGFATIKTEHKPFLIIAKNGKERGYLPLKGNSALSLSTFDVKGEEVQKGLKGFIYGERGVWRPGDTIFTTFILEDKNKTLPENHPVIYELIDPKGKLFKKLIKTSNVNGFYTFFTPTEETSPTGNWNIRIRVGGAVFEKVTKVETVKPNRLEINLDLAGGKSYVSSNIIGTLNAKYLHGALASNLNAKIAVTLSPSTTSFSKYPDYIFDDPVRTINIEEKVIFDGKLDAQGNANINATVDPGSEAPGMLKAGFVTKVFEESGDFSIDMTSYQFSPFKYYVGVKFPKTSSWMDMLYLDSTNVIQVATVNEDGAPATRGNLDVKVYKIEWRWWWDGTDNDLATYISNSSRTPVFSKKISTVNGKGQFNFKVSNGEWGRYVMIIKDADGHSTGKVFYMDWPGWYNRNRGENAGGASVLSISTDKQKYIVGEKAIVHIPSNTDSKALVSIESGSKIIDMYWTDVESKDKQSSIEIPITPEMSPNVFINISLLQPSDYRKNDAPLRMFGYTPILVEDPGTILEPILQTPDKIGSEERFNISVKEKNGKPMTYTIAIVDEGLLGLTHYKTPNPHNAFYAREALGIKTWDMYDLVFGAFGGKIEQVFAIGGDGDIIAAKAKKNAERFKPIVKVLGPFVLEKGKTANHSVKLPKYNGAVRAMLVAGQDGAYGNAEKSIKVKDVLMITATLPRVLGPAEKVTMPVTIFIDEPSIKNVKLEVEANALLIPVDSKVKNVSVSGNGTEIVDFNFTVPQKLGIAKVKVTATSGKFKADYEIELNVRNPNPTVYRYGGALVQANQNWTEQIEMVGMPGTNKAIFEVSSLPPMDLGRRLDYLITYPHGCIEQTTSGVFPQLYLGDVLELSQEKKAKMESNVTAGINRIKNNFQNSDGGLSYWPGENSSNEWGSNYGGHFMLEAEKKGFKLPSGFKTSWLNYQKTKARNAACSSSYYYYDDHGLTQAYRLYTLALAGQPEFSAMNRLKECTSSSIQTKWMLAAAYLLASQDEIAKQIVSGLSTEIKPYQELGYTYGSDLRDRAMILETFSLMKDYKKAADLTENISKELSSEYWLSTQTLGYCLISIFRFMEASNMNKGGLDIAYNVDNTGLKTMQSKGKIAQIEPDVLNKSKISMTINNKNSGTVYVRYYLSGNPVAGEEKDEENDLSMKIVYNDMDGNYVDVSELKQGTDFKAIITIKNTSLTEYYQNLALTQIVPSGWEIINTRLGDIQNAGNSVIPDYQDVRDDRILSYFNLSRGESKTFSFLFNSSYLGEFYMPMVSCEAMYNHKIYSHKAGKIVKVVK